ncbi:MAG: ribosome maturation factor RimP [Gammaproteobacteria bacterium]|nr:ribosome maturation factor RimP [Gammaproteobacteria bacterium]
MRDVDITLRDRLASLVKSMGYEFVGCELHRQGRGSLLRIYIDSEAGILVDDCSKVSRQVSAMLDVEDPIPGQYTLEVSSPGLDRPLFEKAHYIKVVGSQIKVRLHTPIEDRRNFVGLLLRVEDANISLRVDDQELILPFSNIEKAKVIADLVG